MLKQVQLELLTGIDMLMFVESGIRGGISQCCNRYAKANNQYMVEDYNANESEKYLMYFDVNNLFGWAMTDHCLMEISFCPEHMMPPGSRQKKLMTTFYPKERYVSTIDHFSKLLNMVSSWNGFTRPFNSIRMRGWKNTSTWIAIREKTPRMDSRRCCSSSSITQFMERPWRMSARMLTSN